MKAALLPISTSLFSAMLLAGCVDDRPGVPGPARECRAGPAQRFVGAPFNPRTGKAIRSATGARTLRPAGPDQAVTMDFRPDRATIELDGNRRVRAIRCG